jgi:hypothetical protein
MKSSNILMGNLLHLKEIDQSPGSRDTVYFRRPSRGAVAAQQRSSGKLARNVKLRKVCGLQQPRPEQTALALPAAGGVTRLGALCWTILFPMPPQSRAMALPLQ